MKRKVWTREEIAYLIENYPSVPTGNLAETLGVPVAKIHAKAGRLKLRKTDEFLKGLAAGRLKKGESRAGMERTQFKVGHVPANKGLRRPGWFRGRMRETQFKKGERSGFAARNWVPVGTIRPDPDGYLRIKVREAESGKEPTGFGNTRVWPLYSRFLWEQHHGAIPDKHLVIFRDGDRENCAIENLELISMADNARRNAMWKRFPRELVDVIQLNGALKRRIRKLNAQEHDQGSA